MDENSISVKKPLKDRIEENTSSDPEGQSTGRENLEKSQKEPTEYFHQYFSDSKKKVFPPSLVVTDTQQEKNMILSEKAAPPNKGEFKFFSSENPSITNGDYKFKLFSNKNMVLQAIDSFKVGRHYSSQQFDKVFVAMDRGLENTLLWVNSKKNEITKSRFKDSEIPFSELEKIGINRKSLSREDLQALKTGGYTSLKNIELKSQTASIKNTPDFRINLERIDTGEIRARLTFQKKHPDLEKDAIGSQLSSQELRELANNGKLTNTINFSDGKGSSIPNKIMIDRETNQIIRKPVHEYSQESIEQIKNTYGITLSENDEKNLSVGKSIKVNNIHVPDLKGTYRGEMDLNPLTGNVELNIEGPDRQRKKEKEITIER